MINIKRWIGLGLALYLFLGIGGFISLVLPQRVAIQKLKEERRNIEPAYLQIKSSPKIIEAFQKELKVASKIIEEAEWLASSSNPTGILFLNLNQVALKKRVKILSLEEISKKKYGEGKESLSWKLAVEGSYYQLLSFIDRMERSPNYLKIEEITISPGKEDNLCRMVLTLSGLGGVK